MLAKDDVLLRGVGVLLAACAPEMLSGDSAEASLAGECAACSVDVFASGLSDGGELCGVGSAAGSSMARFFESGLSGGGELCGIGSATGRFAPVFMARL